MMEVVEGEVRAGGGFIFKKVGPDLRVVDGGFSSTIPLQALAISNKFGLTFFIDSSGFCVARTSDLVQASQGLLEFKSARESSLASINLSSPRSLTLSQDELVLAVCAEDQIHFYNVASFIHKGENGLQEDIMLLKSSPIMDREFGIKTMSWNPVMKSTILALSRGGNLMIGDFTAQPWKVLAEDVEAADWSPDGQYVCYVTSDRNLHVSKLNLSLTSTSKLPSYMFGELTNGSPEASVDMVKWVSVESILISLVHTDLDGEEDDCWIYLLVSSEAHISKDPGKAKVLSFEHFFSSIDASILPPATGPYILTTYIQPWELLVVTSRRSIDDHISLVRWSKEGDQKQVYKLELDDWSTPRIELQVNGDDNCVVGLATDRTTSSIEIPAPKSDNGEKLRPGPVLMCMTIEGNLSLFSIARTDLEDTDVEVITLPAELPEAGEVLRAHGLPFKSPVGTEAMREKSAPAEVKKETVSKEPMQETLVGREEPVNKLILSGASKVKEGVQEHDEERPVVSKAPVNKEVLQGQPASVTETGGWTKPEKATFFGKQGLSTGVEGCPELKEASFSTVSEQKPPFFIEQKQASVPVTSISLQKSASFGEQKQVSVSASYVLAQKSPIFGEQMQASVPVSNVPPQKSPFVVEHKQTSAPVLSVPGQKSSLLGEQKQASKPALTETELAFVRELTKVKGMAEEINEMIASIEGYKDKSRGGKPMFSKFSVEELESETRNLFRQCQNFEEKLLEQRRSISELRDESLQVDAWRVYVQTSLEQVSDVRYQELWSRQKLNPELDVMRKRILEADHLLKQQIAELEGYLQNLELSQWKKKHPSSKHPNNRRKCPHAENLCSLQSLYDTVNAEMAVSQQLAHRLEAQMEVLKLPLMSKEDVENLVSTSGLKLQNIALKDQLGSDSPSQIRDRLNSSGPSNLSPGRAANTSLQTPVKAVVSGTASSMGLQDSTRRRRDSVDQLWIDVGAAKTTVKRAAPVKRFEGLSYSPQKGGFDAGKVGFNQASPAGPDAGSLRKLAMGIQGSKLVQRTEGKKQTRNELSPGASWTPVPQGSTQMALPASNTLAAPWLSNAAGITDQKPNSLFPKAVASQTVSLSNDGKLQAAAVTQKSPESPFQSFPLSQPRILESKAPQAGPSRFQSTSPIVTPQFTSIPVGSANADKIDLFKIAPSSVASTTNVTPVATAVSELQQKSKTGTLARFGISLDPAQQGTLPKSEAEKQVIPKSSNILGEIPSSQNSLFTDSKALQERETPEAIASSHSTTTATLVNEIPKQEAEASVDSSMRSFSYLGTEQGKSKIIPAIGKLDEQERMSPSLTSTSGSQSVTAEPWTMTAATSTDSPLMKPVGFPSLASPSFPIPTSTAGTLVSSSAIPISSTTFSMFNVSSSSSSSSSSSVSLFGAGAASASTPNVSTPFMAPLAQPVPTAVTPPTLSDEEDMEEEVNGTNEVASSSFAGFGLGLSVSSASSQRSDPFGMSSVWSQSSPMPSLSLPAGQLFKPASFSIPTPQSTAQPSSTNLVNSNLGSGGGSPFGFANSSFGSPAQPTLGFGQPAHPGSSGQQALGSALGTFGQTRQIGSPFGIGASPSGFGVPAGGGLGSAATGGGFASATSGGFAGVAASSGGFAGVAVGTGGFGAFGGGGGGGFSSFSGNTNSSIFTQMRK